GDRGHHAAVAVLEVAARPLEPAALPAAADPDAAHAVLDVASDDPPRRVLGLLERLAVVVGAPALGVIVAVRERAPGPLLCPRLRRRVERAVHVPALLAPAPLRAPRLVAVAAV